MRWGWGDWLKVVALDGEGGGGGGSPEGRGVGGEGGGERGGRGGVSEGKGSWDLREENFPLSIVKLWTLRNP